MKAMNKLFNKIISFDKDNFGLFGFLPSFAKIFFYRITGAAIERGVLIPRGTYIISGNIHIGENTRFGKNSYFCAAELSIGKYAQFEDNVFWCCRKITVGEMFYCSARAKVGWGGEFDEEALLCIGDSSFIGEEVMLNPTRMIQIGNNSAIGAGTKIYTHQFWQSVLDGYEARFRPVIIGDDVMVGCNCAILPGTEIRRGSTITANSTVCGIVKELSLVGGIPAIELPASKIYPRKMDDRGKEKILLDIYNEFLAKKIKEKKEHYLYVFNCSGEMPNGKRTVLLVYYCGFEGDKHVTVFNCSQKRITGVQDKLSDELREFLRKRGIKFSPLLWRYKRKR